MYGSMDSHGKNNTCVVWYNMLAFQKKKKNDGNYRAWKQKHQLPTDTSEALQLTEKSAFWLCNF